VTAEEQADMALGMIEATNALADGMDAMKRALEERSWSTPMAEQVGAAFGATLFAMMGSGPQRPSKRPRGVDG
jgi:hypothetical protein